MTSKSKLNRGNYVALAFGLVISLTCIHAQSGSRDLPGYLPINNPGIDFNPMPPANNTQDAFAGFDAREKAVVAIQAGGTLCPYTGNGVGFTNQAVAKLAGGVDVETVNRALLSPSANVYAKTGSDFHDIKPFCERSADYDFMLRGLIPLIYYNWNRPELLWPQTQTKVLHELLSEKGNGFHTDVSFGICGTFSETENHVLMTEGSRYLTNQLLQRELRSKGLYDKQYDNEANGMNRYILTHLQQFFKNDFSEYNSRPYQAYTVEAVQNIFEFAEDARVKLAAEMLLNYLDMKFSISSNGLRRSVPFRRQIGYKDKTELLQHDAESARFVQMAGVSPVFADLQRSNYVDFGSDRMLFAALGSYRTPELIMDLVLDKSHTPYFQAFHHTGIELYTSSKNFLISAGGVWIKKWDWWTGQNSGWAVPTTLMPTRGGLDVSEFIRFKGDIKNEKNRVNTCISRGFACGLNPVVPDSIPASCLEKQGPWTFVNFDSEACPLKYGFYAVVYQAACDNGDCRDGGNSFGFFEAAEPSAKVDYATFKANVLEHNANRTYHSSSSNVYINQYGQEIRFRPLTNDKYRWGIEAVGGTFMATDINHWPLAYGDIMHADSTGLVIYENPSTHERLTLDMRDPMNPRRTLEKL